MIEYVTWATFFKWEVEMRKEIRERMIASGCKNVNLNHPHFSLTNKMTRKHIGLEFNFSENGNKLCHNVSRTRPEPPVVKEQVIKLNILNKKKFIYFVFKYNIKLDFIDKQHIYM
jgi:hypothetical protein